MRTSLGLDTIYTIGHSTRPIDELLNLLHAHRIQFILRTALLVVNHGNLRMAMEDFSLTIVARRL